MEKVATAAGFVPTPEQAEAIAYRKGNLSVIRVLLRETGIGATPG